MYEYVKGVLTSKHPTYVVVEAGGLGYRLHISLNTYSKIEKEEHVRLWTYLHVKEDDMSLYGFADRAERSIFELLISVSGVGTNTARLILSSLKAAEVQMAIASKDVKSFKAVKGIGEKTAQRIILDLKDKVEVDERSEAEMLRGTPQHNSVKNEAFSALIALGFQGARVRKVLNSLSSQGEGESVEDYIKLALKKLS